MIDRRPMKPYSRHSGCDAQVRKESPPNLAELALALHGFLQCR
jgi:hypothetical protein